VFFGLDGFFDDVVDVLRTHVPPFMTRITSSLIICDLRYLL